MPKSTPGDALPDTAISSTHNDTVRKGDEGFET